MVVVVDEEVEVEGRSVVLLGMLFGRSDDRWGVSAVGGAAEGREGKGRESERSVRLLIELPFAGVNGAVVFSEERLRGLL